MSTTRKGTRLSFLDRIFDTSLILKGLDGLLELVGGLLLLLVSPKQISIIIMLLTQHELSQDPKDFIATHLVAYAHTLTASVTLFAAAYLLVHGIVKIVLVAALLKEQLWAYPWMIGFLGIFILYQIYRLILHISVGLIALTVFDCFIVLLTVLEYRKHLRLHLVASLCWLLGTSVQENWKGAPRPSLIFHIAFIKRYTAKQCEVKQSPVSSV